MKSISFLILLAAALPVPALAQEHVHDAHAMHAAAPLSARDAEALRAQVEAVRAATERYRDHANAVKDGFRLFGQESPLMGEHWYRRDLVGASLDLRHPSTLQYANVGGRKVLAGVAYSIYRRPGEPLPEGFAGADDHWHTHDIARLASAATADWPVLHWLVQRRIQKGKLGPDGRTLLTMVHAWVWSDNPDGTFALQQRALPYLRAGLPAAWAARGDTASAEGIQLLAPGACRGEVERMDRLARLDRAQERALASACEQHAARLRALVGPGADPDAANTAAARAWGGYLLSRGRILRPEQSARIHTVMAAAMEHEMTGL
ncbi:MAG TPA: hypothetical protein VGO40_09880 [Longimicrobium sp.]|nr:hypothetical protein [Longimicrobium sp.]